MAQGTIRPWSERAFFLAFESIFGVNALPFRICVFLTQCANLTLLAAISRRLTGSLLAGFSAAILWLVNNSDTSKRDGARTTYGSGSAFSLVSALAALYNCLCARRFFRSTLPLFLPSAIWRRCCRFAITSRRTTASRAPGRRIRRHDDQRGPQQIARRTYRSPASTTTNWIQILRHWSTSAIPFSHICLDGSGMLRKKGFAGCPAAPPCAWLGHIAARIGSI